MFLVRLGSMYDPKKYPHGYYPISSGLSETFIVSGS